MITSAYPVPSAAPARTFLAVLTASCLVCLSGLVSPTVASAQSIAEPKYSFDVPAGDAKPMLRQFAAQAQREIVFPIEAVEGIRTRAVKGKMTAQEAVDLMLADTGLIAAEDRTGAFAVRKETPSEAKKISRAIAGNGVRPGRNSRDAATGEGTDDDVLELSPFSVQGDAVVGYQAKTTLASTRLRTNLNDVGTALQIVTAQFMKDTGATDNQSLLTYTTSTEVGGFYGNFGGMANTTSIVDSTGRPDLNTRIRGLYAADNTREFEISSIKWDSYNINTVEIQRGANTILFGLGKPSGLINASLKQADYKNAGEVSFRFDGEGSIRGTVDVNQVLLKKQLALRVDLLKDNRKFRQKPAFNNDARVFTTVTFEPEIFNRRSAHTALRVSYEKGRVTSENPRALAPGDNITPWFKTGTYTDLNGRETPNPNKGTIDLRYGNLYFPDVPGSGFALASSPNYQPWVTELYQGNFAYFNDPNAAQQSGNYMMSSFLFYGMNYGIGASGNRDGNIGGFSTQMMRGLTYNSALWATQAKVPFASRYVATSLNDPSIFDFYNKLIDGPSRREGQDFEALNASLSQTFFNNHIGLEAKFDHQRYHSTVSDPYGGSAMGIGVDINEVLPDGSANPNVGRPYILADYYYGGSDSLSIRQSSRLTGFVDVKAEDLPFLGKGKIFSRILGRHVLTGVVAENSSTSHSMSGAYSALAPTGGQADPHSILGNTLDPYLRIKTISYLGPDMRNLSSPAGLNLSPVNAARKPTSTALTIFDSTWNKPTNPAAAGYVNPADPWYNPLLRVNSTQSENPANYVGWVSLPVQPLYWDTDSYRLATSGTKGKQTIDSKIFVWQGYMFDGNLIPLLGYREDTAKAYSQSAPALYGYAQLGDPSFVMPTTPYNTVSGINRTYSLVGHTPQFIRKHLPFGLEFSAFVNKSKDFEPSANRVDILKQPLPAPYGETKDYGITASAFNGRLALKFTKFKTVSAAASSSWQYMWVAGADVNRAWILAKRYEAGLSGDPTYAGPAYNIGRYVDGVYVITAEDRARQQAMVTATLTSPFINDPVFWKAWRMEQTDALWKNLDLTAYTIPPNMTGLMDVEASGSEIELYAKPTNNWDITMNVAKITVRRTNIFSGGANAAWLAEGEKLFVDGLVGQLPRYTGDAAVTLGDQWKELVSTPLQLLRTLSGASNAEIRPWRYNFVTNYKFSEGRFKGVNVGLGYQWQDKVVLGYPGAYATINGVKSETVDVSSPFYGPSDDSVNLWAGYSRKISRKITWHIQANVVNALGEKKLIPVTVQPDGSPGALRIKLGPSWTITNRFSF